MDRVVAKVTVLEALQDELLNENVRLKNDSARMKQENLQLKQTVLGLVCVCVGGGGGGWRAVSYTHLTLPTRMVVGGGGGGG